jgi:hypothetical protein
VILAVNSKKPDAGKSFDKNFGAEVKPNKWLAGVKSSLSFTPATIQEVVSQKLYRLSFSL